MSHEECPLRNKAVSFHTTACIYWNMYYNNRKISVVNYIYVSRSDIVANMHTKVLFPVSGGSLNLIRKKCSKDVKLENEFISIKTARITINDFLADIPCK